MTIPSVIKVMGLAYIWLADSLDDDIVAKTQHSTLYSHVTGRSLVCVLGWGWKAWSPPGASPTAARRRGQVNYVESSKFGDAEAEFLFAPYSAFTVVSVAPSAPNSYLAPHVITLAAAVDNRLEPEDLPLAPWY